VALLALAICPRVATAGDTDSIRRDPKELGRVVLYPFLDVSGDRQEAMEEYRETALSEVEERFRRHGVAYFKREELSKALAELKLVPTAEEDRTKTKLKLLADTLKARYVITGTIHNSTSDSRKRGLFGEETKEGQAKVQFRVFDAKSERYIEEMELTASSKARAKGFTQGIFSRANKLRVKAVRDATKKAMAAFLKSYPQVYDQDPGESFLFSAVEQEAVAKSTGEAKEK
jgi:hypothetical protein